MRNTKLLKEIPFISVKQMIEVDRLMIEDFGISLLQMMENAGRNLTIFAIDILGLSTSKPSILLMAGSGGNGGGIMVTARHLSNKGFDVDIVFSDSKEKLKGIIKHQADILSKLPINIYEGELPQKKYDLIIDGIIGYSLKGNPRGFAKQMIDFCNDSNSKIISLDTPSGLDLDGSTKNKDIVKADYTMTLALPKIGLSTTEAKNYVGKLFLADISVPPSLYAKMDLKVSSEIFEDNYVVKLE